MKEEELLQQLASFNEPELIFRSYYLCQKSPKAYSRVQTDKIQRQYVRQLEKINYPKDRPDHIREADSGFFHGDVGIVKHMRYIPSIIHTHDFFEIAYVLRGTCIQCIDDQQFLLQEGDFCFMNPDQPHVLKVFEDHVLVINILLKASTLQQIFFRIFLQENLLTAFFRHALFGESALAQIIFHTQGDKHIRTLVLQMIEEHREKQDYSQTALTDLTQLLLIRLVRNYLSAAELTNKKEPAGRDIVPILTYVQDNFRDLSLTRTAAVFSYSEAYLSRLIKKYTGKSFSTIILEQKLHQALLLLQSNNLSMQEIALQSGFSDVSHFYRCFKKQYQITPGAYQNKKQS